MEAIAIRLEAMTTSNIPTFFLPAADASAALRAEEANSEKLRRFEVRGGFLGELKEGW